MVAAMKVALYLRVSTEEQRERQSIETQRDFGERFCQLHQLHTVGFYVDDSVSGTVPMELRSAGKQVLDDAHKGQFDQLLVFRLDRLGRETRLILNVVAELEKYGVRVKSMTEEFDTATVQNYFMLFRLSPDSRICVTFARCGCAEIPAPRQLYAAGQ
jgi:site-specific DNA recombinase